MNPNATRLWPHSRSALALLLALLGMLGPFSIDTYLPAFDGIARAILRRRRCSCNRPCRPICSASRS